MNLILDTYFWLESNVEIYLLNVSAFMNQG